MAKREISSTLKNLKFMQRAVQKEKNLKKEESLEEEDLNLETSSPTVNRKCLVILEAGAHYGPPLRTGRMDFGPTVEVSHQPEASPRENDSLNDGAECSTVSEMVESTKEELKRKYLDMGSEPEEINKSPKVMRCTESQKSGGKSSKKKKTAWKVLKRKGFKVVWQNPKPFR